MSSTTGTDFIQFSALPGLLSSGFSSYGCRLDITIPSLVISISTVQIRFTVCVVSFPLLFLVTYENFIDTKYPPSYIFKDCLYPYPSISTFARFLASFARIFTFSMNEAIESILAGLTDHPIRLSVKYVLYNTFNSPAFISAPCSLLSSPLMLS